MRLIDADALRRRICCHMAGVIYRGDGYIPTGKDSDSPYEFLRGYEEGAKQIANMVLNDKNIVDAVPVVRCKDCKHWGGRHGTNECSLITTITEPTYWAKTQPDDFCSSGERRSDD